MKDNFFIVIEGVDNSGKSTLIKLLKTKLGENKKIKDYFGSKIVFTSEPYGPEEEDIKYKELSNSLLSRNYNLCVETIALIFLAIRAEHLNSFILPKIRENFLIICDRFYPSTLAYQVYLQGLNLAWIQTNINYLLKGIEPRVIFFLEVSWKNYTAFYLDKSKRRACNKYDCGTLEFYKKLIKAYDWVISMFHKENKEFVIIPEKLSWAEKVALITDNIEALISREKI